MAERSSRGLSLQVLSSTGTRAELGEKLRFSSIPHRGGDEDAARITCWNTLRVWLQLVGCAGT